jgi:hypothetical protein
MKVAMRIKISGGRGDSTQWPDPGVPFEVDDAEGVQLCSGGLAYPVAADEAETPEDPLVASTEVRWAEADNGAGPDEGGFLPDEAAEDEPPEPDEPEPLAAKPIVNSPKARWVEHAVAQGLDRAEAEVMKKSELIKKFGGPG